MGVVSAILILTIAGMPVARAIDRNTRGLLLLGLGFLYGCGVVYFVELALPHWNAVTVTIGVLVLATACAVLARPAAAPHPRTRPHVIDALTAILAISYVIESTIAPLWEWDFWAIWGLKGRVFFEHHGVDWRFLTSPWNDFAHPDYPLLVPLSDGYAAMMNGAWDDTRLGLLSVAWAVALLLVIRHVTARETTPLLSAIITFACAPIACSAAIGLAEPALIAYGAAALLLLRGGDTRHAAVLLGLAACTKNEGLTLLAATLLVLVIADAPRALRMWPAIVIAAPWQLLRLAHHLTSDLAQGDVLARVTARLPHAPAMLLDLGRNLADRWTWLAILIALIIVIPRRRDRAVYAILAVQFCAFLGAYLCAVHSYRWYIATSWARLTRQLLIPALVPAMLALAQLLHGGQDAAHAEARSDL